ncbi:MAG: HAD family phosphatase [Deltaproteobacteria bacterium]|nr:HAD family phosphatase [Deltaproteobacteria bacterium]
MRGVIRLMALDVDGTLARRGDEVSPATREALHRVHEEGVEVVIATGRRYRTTRRVIDGLGLAVASVTLGGALVKDAEGATIHCKTLSAAELQDVASAYRAVGVSGVGQRDGHADGGPDFVIDGSLAWNGWTSRYAEKNSAWCEWRKDLAAETRDDVIELCAFGTAEDLGAAEAEVHRRHPGRFESLILPLPSDASSGGGFFLEVRPPRTCKWTGLGTLLDARGLEGHQVCAVGDERNDLSMIRGAGFGVAMANGHPEVHAAADWITGRHDEDGLVAVVERLLG